MIEHRVFLSRRNIQTLLNKLDRVKSGETSACTLIKGDNQHAKYPQTMTECAVTAIEGTAQLPGDQNHIYLTREDLKSLLLELDSKKSNATLVSGGVAVMPLEDKEYYDTREPGMVLPVDDPGMRKAKKARKARR